MSTPQSVAPWTAATLSAVCSGLGQLCNRQYAKGALFLAMFAVACLAGGPRLYEGLRGLITLGDTPTVITNGELVKGDHSIFLLINGLMALIVCIALLLLHVMNVRDAYRHALHSREAMTHTSARSSSSSTEARVALLLLLPSLLFILFVSVIPLVFNVLIAFTNYSSPNHIPDRALVDWVGLKTFRQLFAEQAWRSTFLGIFVWNIVWTILSTLSVYFGGMAVAMMVNHRRIRFKKLWRTIFILPWALPSFIAILIFRVLFNGSLGPINGYLEQIGLSAVPWLSDGLIAKLTVLIVNFWIAMPFLMALMSGILTTVPRDLYEAAEVDGAGGWARFSFITLPHVMLASAPILIMQFASNFNNFNLIYLLTDGGPAKPSYYFAGSTDILLSWIYKMTLQQYQFNMASAVSIIMFLLIASISIWNYSRTKSFREGDVR